MDFPMNGKVARPRLALAATFSCTRATFSATLAAFDIAARPPITSGAAPA